MSLTGSFQSMSPSDLLQMLQWGDKTGFLTCIGQDERHHLFLQNGNVVGVTSSRYTDRLGAVLVRLGYLSENNFEEVFLAHASNKKQIGEVILEKKLVKPELLQHALVVQAEDIVYDLLTWGDGEFSFEERILTDTEVKIKPIIISSLLLEGARRIDEINRFRQSLNDPDQVFRLTNNSVADLKTMTRAQRTIVSLLKTSRSFHDIMHMANESEYDILHSLYHLLDKKLIEKDTEETNRRKQENAKVEYLLELVENMEQKGWFHEALSNITESDYSNSAHSKILEAKKRLESKVYDNARRVFGSTDTIPKIRQAVADVSVDKLNLNQSEGFVFFRLDGTTSLRHLRHLTGMQEKELYIILHKFMRMGLIYFDEPIGNGIKH